MIRVILSESRPLLRRGLLATLADDDGIGVLATAATLAEALALDARHAPDVHLFGASLPPAGGEAATQLLVRSRADANVIIVAEGDPDGRERPCPAYRALAAGARGYLDHDAEPAETLYVFIIGGPMMIGFWPGWGTSMRLTMSLAWAILSAGPLTMTVFDRSSMAM